MTKFKIIFLFFVIVTFFPWSDFSIAQTRTQRRNPERREESIIKEPEPNPNETFLIINRFVSDPELETHLIVTDAEGIGVKIKIQIYDEDGNLKYDKYEILNPFGKINIDPHHCVNGEKMVGNIRVFSDEGKVVGQYWQFYKTAELGYKNIAISASDGKGFTKVLCQHFVSNPDVEAYIVVSNIEDDKPAVVNVKYYDDEGSNISVKRKVIQPNGSIYAEPYKDIEMVINGIVVVESEMGVKITGDYWQHSFNEKYQIALQMEGIIIKEKESDVYEVDFDSPPTTRDKPETFLDYTNLRMDPTFEGSVQLYAYIDEKGRVEKTEIITGINSRFDRQASRATMRLIYRPAIKNAKAVKSKIILSVPFKGKE